MLGGIYPVSSLTFASFAVWVFSAAASPAQSGQKERLGKVVVADVVGKVVALHPESESPRSLKTKDTITEKHTVKVDVASSATLVFSNGSIISLLEKSTLAIEKFLQDPFSTPFAMPIATGEPTTSTTKLNLIQGEVVCDVKQLRTDEGSSLTVDTPVGAAGIRGTIFAVSFLPNLNGTDKGIYILSVTEGEVAMTDRDGNVTIVGAGQELVIRFRTEEDPLTGETIVIEILSRELRDIAADRLAMINRVVAKGRADAENIIFEGTDPTFFDYVQFPDFVPLMVNPRTLTEVNP